MNYVPRLIVIGLCVLTMATAARAGQRTGALEGAAADSSGARLPGVIVEVASRAAGAPPVAHTTTDADGVYRFTSLRPGNYIVRFLLAGFSAAQLPARIEAGVTLSVVSPSRSAA